MVSSVDSTAPDPSFISDIPTPPFVRLPSPNQLFSNRAARFSDLAEGHELAPYLRFLAELCQIQATIQDAAPDLDATPADIA